MKRMWIISIVAAVLLAACARGGEETTTTGGQPTPGTTMDGMGGMDHDHGGGAACSPSGTTVTVVADKTAFSTDCLAAPAGQPFTISFENKDAQAHSIAILESHQATDVLFRSEIVPGPKTMTFDVPALKAGTYAFHCEVHPSQMSGTFVVK